MEFDDTKPILIPIKEIPNQVKGEDNLNARNPSLPDNEPTPFSSTKGIGSPKKLPPAIPGRPDINPNGNKRFWNWYGVAVLLVILFCTVYFGGVLKNIKLTPQVNNSITNNYDFKPQISAPVTAEIQNDYEHTINVNIDISDEFIDKILEIANES